MNVNIRLVAVGAAAPYFCDGRRGKYANRLEALAKRARAKKLGLWAACPVRRTTRIRRRNSTVGQAAVQESAALVSLQGGVLVLASATTHPMIAVSDIRRAHDFYSGTLGLTTFDDRGGAVRYETRRESWFQIYESEFAEPSATTWIKFDVEDIEATVKELRDRGVVFEEYDLPGIKTVDGIARHESGARGAWFKDPEGNILQIGQYDS